MMAKRVSFGISFALAFLGIVCLLQAQPSIQGFPPGTFQNLAARDAGSGAAYVGPGDTVSGALAWWGFRCYNTAYSGNVARIQSPSDALTTTITCSPGGVIGSTGTALGTTCAVSCTVDVMYDQSGASNCSGACNLTQTTEADRPTLIQSCQNGKNCLQWTQTSTSRLCNVTGFTQAQPFTVPMVANRNSTGSGVVIFVDMSGGAIFFYPTTANTVSVFSGTTTANATASENAPHSIIFVMNSPTVVNIVVDGSSNTGTDSGNNGFFGPFCMAANPTGAGTFRQMEIGMWNGAFSGGNITAMTSNQRDATSGWNF